MSYSASIMPYISETVHPKIRGSLATLPPFMMAFGMLVTWILGYFLSWRMTAYLLIIPPLILTIFLLPLPETPYWLIENNNSKAAKKSLKFFRGQKYDISDEFNEIQLKHESKKGQESKQSWIFTVQRTFSVAFFKPFMCVGILFIFTSLSGVSVLFIYMTDILTEAGSSIDPNIGPIVVGSCRLVFAGMYMTYVCW